MGERATEIADAVREFGIDIDDIDAIRAIADLKRLGGRLQQADRATVDLDELLDIIDAVLASMDGLLGDGATVAILGTRPKLTELIIAMREVFDQYGGSTSELEEKLMELTETVSED